MNVYIARMRTTDVTPPPPYLVHTGKLLATQQLIQPVRCLLLQLDFEACVREDVASGGRDSPRDANGGDSACGLIQADAVCFHW